MAGAARAAAIGAVLAAGFVIALHTAQRPPMVALRVVGVHGGLDLQGGMAITYELPPGTDPRVVEMLRERIVDQQPGGRITEQAGGVVEIELPGIAASEAAYLADVLGGGGLQFRAVINDAPVMRKLFAYVYADPQAKQRGIGATPDSWLPDSGGKQSDYYLFGPDPEELSAYIADTGIAIPAEGEILFERVDRAPDDVGPSHAFWRSYYVERRVDVDGWAVGDAMASYDPQTGRPLVLVDFTRDGTAAFADLTRRSVGRKIATVIGGRIASAPIVNSPILGGRCSITMGGTDYQAMERDARALVSVLRMGPLPPGGTLKRADYIAPSVTAGGLWLARALAGAVVGAVVFLVGFVLGRRSTAIAPAAAFTGAATRPAPVRALVVTLCAPVALWLAARVHMPGMSALTDSPFEPAPEVSAFALGLRPLLTAFLLVELVVLAVPSWRRFRLTPDGRRRIGVAVVAVAIVVGVVYGWRIARLFQDASAWSSVEITHGLRPVAIIALSTVAATLVLGLIAAAISEYGLGNGFAAMLAAGTLVELVRDVKHEVPPAPVAAVLIAMIAVVAAATLWLVRRRFGDRADAPGVNAPVAGLVPVMWPFALATILNAAIAAKITVPRGITDLVDRPSHGVALVIAIALTVAIGWLAARPGRSAALFGRMTATATPPAPDRRAWAWAAGANVAVVVGLTLVGFAVATLLEDAQWGWIGIAVIAVAIADIVADWRARRRVELVGVWPIHDAALADTAAEVLARAGIAAHLRGRHTRMLFNLFGPFVPIEVMVPADRAGEASALLKDMFDPAARGVTTAW